MTTTSTILSVPSPAEKGDVSGATTLRPPRLASIDLLRGAVMIFMALDHVRDYFHYDAFFFGPEDVSRTTPILFFTRWITHFCAPVFIFLAGLSAYLYGQARTKGELSAFLLKRGLWLIVIELTLVNFAWFFNPSFSALGLLVIWVLGASMILLAGLIHLPRRILLVLAVLMIAGHNLLDPVRADSLAWSIVHQFNIFQFGGLQVVVAYPLVPWVAVMILGYCLGELFAPAVSPERRRRVLLALGISSILAFLAIRAINGYGDPRPWAAQPSAAMSVVSFLNATKYPPSLVYLLMTLGPAFVFLALTERCRGTVAKAVSVFGGVPFFYYLLHLYAIHLLALVAAHLTGFGWQKFVLLDTWVTMDPTLQGYGFNLAVVYAVWAGLILLFYPLCLRYYRYKRAHPEKWYLSYL